MIQRSHFLDFLVPETQSVILKFNIGRGLVSKKEEEEKKSKVIRAINNEVKYLRELYACENIITLDSVYRTLEGYHLVLRYAEHGCLRNHIIKEDLIRE
jgi:serine/threonine protein kinase